MSTNPLSRKFTQVTEESLPPLQVPLILGSQCFMITQQDVRRIEDTRYLTFNRYNPNGGLQPVEGVTNDFLLEILKYLNGNRNCQNSIPSQDNVQHIPLINIKAVPSQTQPMDISENNANSSKTSVKASLEQQLQWDKGCNTSLAFPFHYSCTTSTTDLSYSPKDEKQTETVYPLTSSASKIVRFSKGTNTQEILDAREQRKQRRIESFIM